MPVKYGSTAYYAKLARRRANNAIRELNRIASSPSATTNERATARRLESELKRQYKSTFKYQGLDKNGKRKIASQADIEQATARINSLANTSKIARGRNGAKNLFTQDQINMATRRGMDTATNPSMYTKAQVKAFYRATQKIWQNQNGLTDQTKINKKIMDYFGTKDLAVAMELALSTPGAQKALRLQELAETDISKWTQEQREFYERAIAEDTSDDKQGSPPEQIYVYQFDPELTYEQNVQLATQEG